MSLVHSGCMHTYIHIWIYLPTRCCTIPESIATRMTSFPFPLVYPVCVVPECNVMCNVAVEYPELIAFTTCNFLYSSPSLVRSYTY
jgi:hypothetical protein